MRPIFFCGTDTDWTKIEGNLVYALYSTCLAYECTKYWRGPPSGCVTLWVSQHSYKANLFVLRITQIVVISQSAASFLDYQRRHCGFRRRSHSPLTWSLLAHAWQFGNNKSWTPWPDIRNSGHCTMATEAASPVVTYIVGDSLLHTSHYIVAWAVSCFTYLKPTTENTRNHFNWAVKTAAVFIYTMKPNSIPGLHADDTQVQTALLVTSVGFLYAGISGGKKTERCIFSPN